MCIQTYQVIDGLINGQDGEYAMTVAERIQTDGWYYILDDMDDGVGPFDTQEEAKQYGCEALDDRDELLKDEA
jgi:hypothetical protein